MATGWVLLTEQLPDQPEQLHLLWRFSSNKTSQKDTRGQKCVWRDDGDVMWPRRRDGAVTESAPEAWRVCKNTHLMRVSSCESHLLTFNPELFCLVKQRLNCPQPTVTICDIILKGHRYFFSLWKKGNTLKSDLVLVHSDAHSFLLLPVFV